MKISKFFAPMQKNPNNWMIIIIAVNIAYYVISLIVSIFWPQGKSMEFFSPSNAGLIIMGASGSDILFKAGWVYSLVNANFLHGNVLHLAFNMLAFFQLFKPVCWSYGTDRGITIYLLSGIFAYFCSALMGIQLTIGASGAIFGLMGALLFYGWRRGDDMGRIIFRQIGIWAVLILVMGFMSQGINNVAHLTGLIGGAVLGWGLGFKQRENFFLVLLANILIVITVLCLLYPAVVVLKLIFA